MTECYCVCVQVPVQRVTKYPLLLARLYKVTPAHHESRELLRQSQHKIELHLEHMNSVTNSVEFQGPNGFLVACVIYETLWSFLSLGNMY
jgi:hypothetical protein